MEAKDAEKVFREEEKSELLEEDDIIEVNDTDDIVAKVLKKEFKDKVEAIFDDKKADFAVEVFKRNHSCDLINAIESSCISEEHKRLFLKKIFKATDYNSGIGKKCIIRCTACRETCDSTDYDRW